MADSQALLRNVFLRPPEHARYNRIFVVSAYSGLTNRLLKHKKTGEPGVYALFSAEASDRTTWGEALDAVRDEMRRVNGRLFTEAQDREVADGFVHERIEGVRSCLVDLHRLCSYGHFHLQEHLLTVREMLASLGEAHSAHNTALLLRRAGLESVFVDLTGWREETEGTLDERIERALAKVDPARQLPVLTGYAQCESGLLETYGRGYTEVTFSRAAVLAHAREAIIHKEFHLSSADPVLVGEDKVQPIGRTNYDVADQLSNMGMEAIHPSAAKGLRQASIPLRVKNAFEPAHAGTVIAEDYRSTEPRAEIVTGLRSVLAFEFHEPDMVGVKGYDAAILESLRRHDVRVVSKASNANTITHFLDGSFKSVKRVEADLRERFPNPSITTRKVALVSAIGSDLELPGMTARATAALAESRVTTLGLVQSLRNVDLQFIVPEAEYEKTTRVLHAALVEDAASTRQRPAA